MKLSCLLTPPPVIVTKTNQADASLCLCVQFLIGGLYCYNISEIGEFNCRSLIPANQTIGFNVLNQIE